MRTVKIAYTPPQRRSLWEKLRYKLAVRRRGGPVWARIGDTRQMVRRQCWPTAAPLIWRNDC